MLIAVLCGYFNGMNCVAPTEITPHQTTWPQEVI